MQVSPDFPAFEQPTRPARAQVVWTQLVADLETPVSAFLKLADGAPSAACFESVEGGAIRGRYSFIGLKPDLIWRCKGETAEINRQARWDIDAFEPLRRMPPLASLRAGRGVPHRAAAGPAADGRRPGRLHGLRHGAADGGAAGDTNPDVLGVPDGIFLRPTVMADLRQRRGRGHRRHRRLAGRRRPARAAYAQAPRAAVRRGRRLRPRAAAAARRPRPGGRAAAGGEQHGARGLQGHGRARAKEYILAGDVFQVVLSQRFAVPFKLPPFSLYRALRRLNPSPFLVYCDFGGFSVVASSPEILVRVRDGKVTIRPLAGTRKRGADAAEDQGADGGLLADPKERAEHLMLLDLGAQRRRPRRQDRLGQGDRAVRHRALQPRHAHRLQRRGHARREGTTRWTP